MLIEREAGWNVCAVAATGREAVEQGLALRPHVIVLDLHMPELNGLDVVRAIRKKDREIEFVLFSSEKAERVVLELFDAGVKAFIRKEDAATQLIAAIRSATEHRPFFTPEVSEILFARLMRAPAADSHELDRFKLSTRERQIIRLIADGKSNKEAATALGISTRTAETHRAAIMRKLNISSTPGLVRFAIRNSIIEA